MTNARPGYWDVERCAWVGAEPTHVVPPVPAAASEAADADAALPTPRDDADGSPSIPATSSMPSALVVADDTVG